MERFAGAPGSVVAFVPPHKLVATLEDAAAVFGGGGGARVCREMTKVRQLLEFFSPLCLSRFGFSHPRRLAGRVAPARACVRDRARACIRVIALCRFWRVTLS